MKNIFSSLIILAALAFLTVSTQAHNPRLNRYSEFEKDGKTYGKYYAAYPTGVIDSSHILLEKRVPKNVGVSEEFAYETVITNIGKIDLENVTVTEKLPAGAQMLRSTPQAKASNGVFRWVFPKLGPNDSVVIRMVGRSDVGGSFNSCGMVSWDDYLCATTDVVNMGLEAMVTAPASSSLCQIIPLIYTATNTGTATLTNVYIDGGKTSELVALDGTRGGYMKLGTLAPGESKQVRVDARATKVGQFDTIIRAVSDQITSAESTAITMVSAPELMVDVTAPTQLVQGRTLEYDISVANRGSVTADKVVVSSRLPDGVQFVSATNGGRIASGNTVVWPALRIPSSQKTNLSVKVRPNGSGSFQTQALANDECAKPASDSATTSVVGVAAILLEVVDSPDPIEIGSSTTYTISVTNQGSAPDTNITLECFIEDTQSYVTSSGATTGSHSSGKVTFRPLAKLEPKRRATWTVTVKGTEASDTRFKVSMTSDQLGRPVEESEATKIY
ncbi:MAG: hypothetical protein AAFY98_00950 [Verrucomicrobiota bacterium]